MRHGCRGNERTFLQRGEPAVVSKWARTKMALQNGVDLVIELPYLYSVQKAEIFARGSVSILNKLGCEALFFGSENGDIEPFLETAKLIDEHKHTFDQRIKEELKRVPIIQPQQLSHSAPFYIPKVHLICQNQITFWDTIM